MQANGHLLPAKEAPNHSLPRSGDGRGIGEKAKPSNRVRRNGNIARRKPGKRIREYWDIDLPGFGLRVNPGGRRTWFVLFRQRGKLRRVSLGTSRDILPATAQTPASISARTRGGSASAFCPIKSSGGSGKCSTGTAKTFRCIARRSAC
jgi:hypothetical protein